jgi:hypothetical protein
MPSGTVPSRAVGVLFVVIGTILLAIAIWSATLAPALRGTDVEGRWLLSSSLLGIIAVAIAAGGAALALRRWWGLLLIAAAMALWAIYPWLLKIHYETLYGFEAPEIIETALLGSATLVVLITYVRKSKCGVVA